MLFSEAIEKFKAWRSFKVKGCTVKGYDLALRGLCLFLRDPDVEDIRLEDILEWFSLQRKLNWDQNSFIPKAIAIRKFLEFFQHQGQKVLDPWLIPIPDKEYKQPRILTEENYQKLLAAIPKVITDPRHIRNEAIIRMLWDTGARNGELMSLNVRDIDVKKMQAIVRTEKAKSRRPFRQIFWTLNTNQALMAWINRRDHLKSKGLFHDDEALFVGAVGTKYGRRLTVKAIGEMLRRYSERAKIEPVNAHSFRHHLGHELVQKGANNSTISSILGHSNLASSFTYTMLNDSEMESSYRKFRPSENDDAPCDEMTHSFQFFVKPGDIHHPLSPKNLNQLLIRMERAEADEAVKIYEEKVKELEDGGFAVISQKIKDCHIQEIKNRTGKFDHRTLFNMFYVKLVKMGVPMDHNELFEVIGSQVRDRKKQRAELKEKRGKEFLEQEVIHRNKKAQ